MYFFKISQTFKSLDLHCFRQKTVSQSDKGLAKITEGASPRRHAETSPVKFKDTHFMNNKLPPAEILCGDYGMLGDKSYRLTARSPCRRWYRNSVNENHAQSRVCFEGWCHCENTQWNVTANTKGIVEQLPNGWKRTVCGPRSMATMVCFSNGLKGIGSPIRALC